MDPHDPLDARQIFVEYARLLERDLSEDRHPARIDSLPYAKPTIRAAIETSVRQLVQTDQLTGELRDYFETAYVSLAEYVDGELARLATEYRRAADQIAAEAPASSERTKSAAWRTLSQSSVLAGEIARATTQEAETLRAEFRRLLASG
jgi:hypothetical protein